MAGSILAASVIAGISPEALRARTAAGVAIALLVGSSLAGCGDDDPPSAARKGDFKAAFADAPRPLKALEARSGQILDGGPEAFERQLARLEGFPVVVNKWASWCGPCRFEFPFFQRLARRHADEIAFLGVDSLDSKEAGRRFLEKYPVPYPSFFDPKGDVAKVFRGDRVFPTTAYYDADGELVFTKQGGYRTQEAIEDDIERYAR